MSHPVSTVIINDCRDDNAMGRQKARVAAEIGGPTVGVGVRSDLEAAGNIIDHLDAFDGKPGIILANVAPRNGAAKHWQNGTPFCYFWYGETLVVSSFDGLALSLVKKLQVTDSVCLMDIPTVASAAPWSPEIKQRVAATQFRSFEFLPRVAALLLQKHSVAHERIALTEVADAPVGTPWCVDNFGNVKTTALPGDIGFAQDATISLAGQTLVCYDQLKAVPDGQAAAVVGSSGLGDKRFVEMVVQGGSMAARLGL